MLRKLQKSFKSNCLIIKIFGENLCFLNLGGDYTDEHGLKSYPCSPRNPRLILVKKGAVHFDTAPF